MARRMYQMLRIKGAYPGYRVTCAWPATPSWLYHQWQMFAQGWGDIFSLLRGKHVDRLTSITALDDYPFPPPFPTKDKV